MERHRKQRVSYVDRPEGLGQVAEAMEGAPRFAIDTESNSLHAYKERVCFLQVAVGFQVFLVDTLAVTDLRLLRPFLEDPGTPTILHGADYDVCCLQRDFGLRLSGLFDTMVAAQLLGYRGLGLAALVEEHCGEVLDKSHTRHDWGRRPLEERYVPYLVEDVIHLEALHDILREELRRADLLEEAEIEFTRVSRLTWSRDPEDPEAWRRIKGAGRLDRKGLAVLRELHALREREAAARDRPAFKVMGNQHLLILARERPRTRKRLFDLQGFPNSLARRKGDEILEAVKRGLRRVDELPPRTPRPPPPPKEQLAVAEGLKRWRRRTAEKRGVPNIVVLPNHAISVLADRRPRTLAELAALENLGTRRVERYGEEILAVIRNPPLNLVSSRSG